MTIPDDARGSAPKAAPRVVFCGMTGHFSLLVLDELLRAGVEVVAVMLPALRERAGQPDLPLLPRRASAPRGIALPLFATPAPRTILDVAAERGIPVLELSGREIPTEVAALTFDALCVACFSRKLPAALLRLPRLGCLNVHPSLLPRHRGPDPLFWIFHDGDETTGVTIHLMDEGFDSGPIVRRATIPLPDGMTEAALERACATHGGRLLAEALAALNAGTAHPEPQDSTQATYESWPSDEDFLITPGWSARRAYRFLAGVGGRAEPLRLVTDGATFVLRAALDYDPGATLEGPWTLDGDVLSVQCTLGVLRCQIAG